MTIEPEIKKILEELGKTQYGKALRIFLDAASDELNDVSTVETWEETVGRREALNVLRKLFDFMEEKKESKASKNQYV